MRSLVQPPISFPASVFLYFNIYDPPPLESGQEAIGSKLRIRFDILLPDVSVRDLEKDQVCNKLVEQDLRVKYSPVPEMSE